MAQPYQYIGGELAGGAGTSTFGNLTNTEILLISTPQDNDSAFSTDDNVMYIFYDGSWYNPVGGVLS